MKRKRCAFTLVELLVVIGIIAVLVGILLPALTKARQQATLIACQSVERQFYNLWQMYAADYRGYAIPARFQTVGAEYDFFEAGLIGQELNKNKSAFSNSGRGLDLASIIKFVFTCPARDHSGDPNADDAAAMGNVAKYWGDYIYNTWMGSYKLDGSGNFDPVNSRPFLKVSGVPNNVIILMESYKPNIYRNAGVWTPQNNLPGNNYKAYFEKFSEIFVQTNPTAGQPSSGLTLLRVGLPHVKLKKMNVLSADGHISTIDPYKDFFTNSNNQATIRDYLWDAKDKFSAPAVTGHPGWKRSAPGI